MDNNKSNLSKQLGIIGDIPALPKVASTVMKLVGDPSSSAEQLQKAISVDEGLSAKVLKMANSAFFGCMSSIKSVRQSIVIIGFSTIKSLVIASSTSSLYKQKGQKEDNISKKLWEHSVGCSFAARMIAKKIKEKEQEEAFTGGLLHDIGRVLINSKFSDKFKIVNDQINKENKLCILAEKKIFGFDHTEVGLFLSEKWKLPPLLSDIICYHHDPEKSNSSKRIIYIVQLADKICIKKGIGLQANEELNLEEEEAAKVLGLKNDDLNPLIEKFYNIFNEEMSLFSLE